jgi:hypothetical protein
VHVADLERSIAFDETLGLEVRDRSPATGRRTWVYLDNGVEQRGLTPLFHSGRRRRRADPRRYPRPTDHAETAARRSAKSGKLTATASAPSMVTPSWEQAPAMAPSMAMRWSPAASM